MEIARSHGFDSPWAALVRPAQPAVPFLLGVFVAHAILALAMRQDSRVAMVHGAFVLGLGLLSAAQERLDRVACVAAYIAGSEVLWRMSGAGLPWEFGKYSIVLILGVTMMRSRLFPTAGPLIYFLLLLPSAVLTINALEFEDAREDISFNLSGHLAVMVSAWFFSNIRLGPELLKKILLTLVAPVSGVSAIALYTTLTAASIHFSNESNFVTSGGYGPNQVSSLLGLGALSLVLYLLVGEEKLSVRVAFYLGALVFAGQSALTLSRSGLLAAVGAVAVALLFVLREPKARFRFLLALLLAAAAAKYVIFPWLDEFTGGIVSARFQDLDTTGRGELMESELELFRRAPVFGIGPGMAGEARSLASHTEFTRLLAEHGAMGLASMAVLLLLCLSNVFRRTSPRSQAFAASMCAWAGLFMLTSGMRVAAPSFAIGLTFVTFSGALRGEREVSPP